MVVAPCALDEQRSGRLGESDGIGEEVSGHVPVLVMIVVLCISNRPIALFGVSQGCKVLVVWVNTENCVVKGGVELRISKDRGAPTTNVVTAQSICALDGTGIGREEKRQARSIYLCNFCMLATASAHLPMRISSFPFCARAASFSGFSCSAEFRSDNASLSLLCLR